MNTATFQPNTDIPEINLATFLQSEHGKRNAWNILETIGAVYGQAQADRILGSAASGRADQVAEYIDELTNNIEERQRQPGISAELSSEYSELTKYLVLQRGIWTNDNIETLIKIQSLKESRGDTISTFEEAKALRDSGNSDQAALQLITHAYYSTHPASSGLPVEEMKRFNGNDFERLLDSAATELKDQLAADGNWKQLRDALTSRLNADSRVYLDAGIAMLDDVDRMHNAYVSAKDTIRVHGHEALELLTRQKEQFDDTKKQLSESILDKIVVDPNDPQGLLIGSNIAEILKHSSETEDEYRSRQEKAERERYWSRLDSNPFGVFKALGITGEIDFNKLKEVLDGKDSDIRETLKKVLESKLTELEKIDSDLMSNRSDEDSNKIRTLMMFGKITLQALDTDATFKEYIRTEFNTFHKRLDPVIGFMIRGSLEKFDCLKGTDEQSKELVQEFRSYKSYLKMFGVDQHADFLDERNLKAKLVHSVGFLDDEMSKRFILGVICKEFSNKNNGGCGDFIARSPALKALWDSLRTLNKNSDVGDSLLKNLVAQGQDLLGLNNNEAAYELIRKKVHSAAEVLLSSDKRADYLNREKLAEVVNETEFLKRKTISELERIEKKKADYRAERPNTHWGRLLKFVPYDDPKRMVRQQYWFLLAAKLANASYTPTTFALFGGLALATGGAPVAMGFFLLAAVGGKLQTSGWNFGKFYDTQAGAIQQIVLNGYNAYTSVKVRTEAFGDKTILEISESAYEAQLMITMDLKEVGFSNKRRQDAEGLLQLSYLERASFELIRMRRKILFDDPILDRKDETEPKSIEQIMGERGVEYYRLKALLFGIHFEEKPINSKFPELLSYTREDQKNDLNGFKPHAEALRDTDSGYELVRKEDEELIKLISFIDTLKDATQVSAEQTDAAPQGTKPDKKTDPAEKLIGSILDENDLPLGYSQAELKEIASSCLIGEALRSYKSDMLRDQQAWYEGGDVKGVLGRVFGIPHFKKLNTSRALFGAEKASRDFKLRMVLLPTEVNGRIFRLRNTKNYKVAVAEEKALDNEARRQVMELGHEPVKKPDGSSLPSWAEMFTIKQMPIVNSIVQDRAKK